MGGYNKFNGNNNGTTTIYNDDDRLRNHFLVQCREDRRYGSNLFILTFAKNKFLKHLDFAQFFYVSFGVIISHNITINKLSSEVGNL